MWSWTKKHRPAELQAITDFNRSLLLVADPDTLQSSVATRLSELFEADRIIILQPDAHAPFFVPGCALGVSDEDIPTLRFHRRGSLARWLLTNETALLVTESRDIVDYLIPAEREVLEQLRISVCLPLSVLNRLTGMLLLGSTRREWVFPQQQLPLLQALALQAGLAFENATLHRQQRDRLRRLYRAERLAATGQLAAGVAHEIRNPLTSIRSTIQYVLPSFPSGDAKRELMEELVGEVDRIDRIVNSLLSLSSQKEFAPVKTEIIELLEQSLLLIGAQARKQGIEIQRHFSEPEICLFADPSQMKQVFLNVLLNALQAMESGGCLRVSASNRRFEATVGEWVEVEIADTGTGIPPEHLDRIFDPFFTLKKEGTGLGLSISYNIVQRHGGDIEARSELGKGTEILIHLPKSPV